MEVANSSSEVAQKELFSLRSVVAALHVEKANLTSNLLTIEFENAQKSRMARSIPPKQLGEAMERIKSLEDQILRMKKATKETSSNSGLDGNESSLNRRIQQLESEIEALRSDLHSSRKELAAAKVELGNLSSIKTRSAEVEEQYRKLEQRLKESIENEAKAAAQVEELQRALADADLEISALRTTFDTTEDTSGDRVAALIDEIAAQNAIHSKQVEALRSRIRELEQQPPQNRAQAESSSRRTVSMIIPNQRQSESIGLTNHKSFMHRLNKIKEDFGALAGSNPQLNQWLTVSFMTVIAHFDAIYDAKEVAERRNTELDESLRRARMERQALLEEQRASADREKYITELQEEKENLQKRTAQLLEVTAGRRQAISEYAEEIRLLKEENTRLTGEIQTIVTQSQTLDQHDELKRDVFLLKEQLEFTTKELKKAIMERNQANQRILHLQAAEEELEMLRKERAKQQAALDEVSKRLEDSVMFMQSAAKDNLEGIAHELEVSRRAFQDQREASQNNLKNLEAERDRLHAEMQLIEREYEEQILDLEKQHRRAIDSLRESLCHEQEASKQYLRRVKQLEADMASMKLRTKELEQKNAVQEQNLARATGELDKIRSMAEASTFKELGVIEAAESSQRLVPASQGRQRAGYSTASTMGADSQRLSSVNQSALRERRMTAARLSVMSPVFKVDALRNKESLQQNTTTNTALEQALKRICRDAPPSVAFRVSSVERHGVLHAVKDGVVGCYLVNAIKSATIDFRTVATHTHLDGEAIKQNWSLCFNSATAIGLNLQGIDENLLKDKQEPDSIFRTCWLLVRQWCLRKLQLSETPSVAKLYEGKPISAVAAKRPENVLRKWVQHVLQRSPHHRALVSRNLNLETVFTEGRVLAIISSAVCGRDLSETAGPAECLSAISSTVTDLPFSLTELHLKSSPLLVDAWMAAVACWSLQNLGGGRTNHSVSAGESNLTQSIREYAEVEVTGTREERALCAWINSLKLSAHVSNLQRDVCDGLVLLHTLERISPGIVDWGKVNLNPRNYFSRLENCNHAVSCCRKLGLSVVGISGSNIADCDSRAILSLTWQASQYHLLSILSQGMRRITENDAVGMANKLLKSAGHRQAISGLRDNYIISGQFFIHLVDAVRPGIVDKDCILLGDSVPDRISNARYAISLARSLGFFVFVVAEDLVQPVPKMVLSFIAVVLSGAAETFVS